MAGYIFRRLLLLPITLFFIVLVNFVIINLAPGEPVVTTEIGAQGEAIRREGQNALLGADERYLQFREFFGLTLPILFNNWVYTGKDAVVDDLISLVTKKKNGKELSAKEYNALRIMNGDRARFVLPQLDAVMRDTRYPFDVRLLAYRFFLRGSHRFIHQGYSLTENEIRENEVISKNNLFLDEAAFLEIRNDEELQRACTMVNGWYQEHMKELGACPTSFEKLYQGFFMTRFSRYLFRVLRLDFGYTRSDPNMLVIVEVTKRLKYSLTLSLLPLLATTFLCLLFGMLMAVFADSFFDIVTNFIFLILYAIPVFVVAPFLIEKVALHRYYPFTEIPFPIRGFSSPDSIYSTLTTWERVGDIFRHITLPLVTILYGALAVESRLARAIFIDTIQQEYTRAARAKGVGRFRLYCVHVGKNAAIPIITSVAGSLGVVLGGSVIVETIFDIHGFGKFFYDAIISRDYNVMMFSVLLGSFLALLGYLVADIIYMKLDPRVNLEKAR